MRHIIVYRQPYSSLDPVFASVFFDEFSQFLENVVMCPEVDNDTKKFMDLLETFSLSQHVSGPTHLSGHTLDLIITRLSDDVVLASPKGTFPISDHFIIQCPIGFPWPALSCKELTFCKLKNIDIAKFSADIASSMLCASVNWDNIDALSDCFNMTLTDILDKHAPLKTRITINRPKISWFNDDIKQLKHKRRRLEKKALKTDLPGDWNNYHKVRNQYSALLNLNLHVWIIIQT